MKLGTAGKGFFGHRAGNKPRAAAKQLKNDGLLSVSGAQTQKPRSGFLYVTNSMLVLLV